ncbi:MAG: alpha/beta hydrolase [Cyclobacteriaceae bacterium]|nr:MAG: alpha/beta hydrolase [Cyclobacteriaceae bacterium]
MYISQAGTGKAVVLIHGFCETHKVWQGIAQQLAKSCHVLLPDLPGFGKSPPLNEPFTIEDAARHLLNRLAAEKVNSLVAIGHSLGGYVALAMARLDPRRVTALGLIHSTALPDSEERKNNRNRVIELIEKHGPGPFIGTFFQNLFANPAHPALQELIPEAQKIEARTLIHWTRAMRDRSDQMPFLSEYPGPVLFLGGAKDPLIPPQSLEEQASRLSPNRAVIKILPDAAHMGMLENSAETYRIITGWLGMHLQF